MGRSESAGELPPLVAPVIGGLFTLLGLYFSIAGLLRKGREARRRALLARSPDETWYADFPWNISGISDGSRQQLARQVFGMVLLVVILAPFNLWAFASDKSTILVVVLVSLFDVALLGAVGYILFQMLRLLKYGSSHLVFENFPFRLGDRVSLRFGMNRDLGKFDSITFILRFVEEVFETVGKGAESSTQVVPYELFRGERVIDASDLQLENGEVLLQMPLPPQSDMITSLFARPPRYWELEVRAKAVGMDYQARFLLPVYLPTQGQEAATAAAAVSAEEAGS